MPTKVTRNGLTSYEYSIQELEEAATQREIQRQVKFGTRNQNTSIFEQIQSINPSHKKMART